MNLDAMVAMIGRELMVLNLHYGWGATTALQKHARHI
jgi:hypothetical protein